MMSKNWKFHKRFNIPQNEEIIEVFSCSVGQPPKMGNLFLSENHICFYSNILSHKTKRVVPLKEVVEMRKGKVVGIKVFYRVSGKIDTLRFSGFKKVNEAFDTLLNHWKRKQESGHFDALEMGPAYFQPPPGKTSSSSLGVLFVTLVEGKEMPRNVKGPVNAFCTLTCGDTFHRSQTSKSTQPKWGQKFAFPLKYMEQVNNLEIRVYDSQRMDTQSTNRTSGGFLLLPSSQISFSHSSPSPLPYLKGHLVGREEGKA